MDDKSQFPNNIDPYKFLWIKYINLYFLVDIQKKNLNLSNIPTKKNFRFGTLQLDSSPQRKILDLLRTLPFFCALKFWKESCVLYY